MKILVWNMNKVKRKKEKVKIWEMEKE